ncbi:MAG TPA: hypothetical protein VFQ61_35510 [Polyangiaceae bacterium]|nr:hypothetical protein [Polyangiaceae bacterium]
MRKRGQRANGLHRNGSNGPWLVTMALLASCGSRSAAELSSLPEGNSAGANATGGIGWVGGTMGRAGSSTRYPEGLGGIPSVAGGRNSGGNASGGNASGGKASGGTRTTGAPSAGAGGSAIGGASHGGDGGAGGEPIYFPPDCRGGPVLVDLRIEDDEQLERELSGRTRVVGTLELTGSVRDLEPLHCLERVEDLVIHDAPQLLSLRGLEQLTEIDGGLELLNLPVLENLIGLPVLQQVGSIELQHNPRLVDLTGLLALNEYSEMNVLIRDNAGLTSLVGLHGVGSLNDLHLESNPLLMDLRGLDQLVAVHNLTLADLQGLRTVAGLDRLHFVKGNLTISGNENLTDLRSLGAVDSVYSLLSITDNARLPTCRAEWLRDQIGITHIGTDSTSPPPHYEISGNDDAATCTP